MTQVLKYQTPFEQLWSKGIKFHREQKRNKMFLNDGTLVLNNKRYIKKSYQIDDIYGFDTETYKGKCKLICRSDGTSKQLLYPTFLECLNFLFYNAKNSHIWRFFYNIDFDYNAIIKTLNLDNAFAKILIIMLNKGLEIKFNKYRITYIKNIMLKIKKGHKTVVFTDLFRVFRMSLNSASIEFLKNEIKENIDGNLLNTSIEYWNQNLNAIISYCIQDCILLKKLGLVFLEHLKEANITIPRYLCSPASLSKAHFRKKCHIPNLLNNPNEIIQIGYDCYYGGRFELLKRGTFEKMYNYDVNSEYPEAISELPSLKYGLWIRHNELTELPKEKCFGFFKVKILFSFTT